MNKAPSPLAPSGLVLFLSVDLSGSTAFKVAAARGPSDVISGKAKNLADSGSTDPTFQKWLPVFTGFYYQFPEYLQTAFELEQADDPGSDLGTKPVFWKPIGDELVFTKRLTHETQAFRTVRAFRTAVLDYRKELRRKNPSLDLKASAWLAGFPIGNTQVPMWENTGLEKADFDGDSILVAYNLAKSTQERSSEVRVDYLGPAMDLGFRIGKIASSRKFVVSIDLAYLLTQTNSPAVEESFTFRYEGRVELKGVLGNKPYPIFWIDMEPSKFELLEDQLAGARPVEVNKVHWMASDFLDSTDGRMCKPYIVRSDKSVHGTVPHDHMAILERLAAKAGEAAKQDSVAIGVSDEGSEISRVDLGVYLGKAEKQTRKKKKTPDRTRARRKSPAQKR